MHMHVLGYVKVSSTLKRVLLHEEHEVASMQVRQLYKHGWHSYKEPLS